jgi:prepilin-type N-terminal cleavage/methylation domain-containing protein
VKNKMKNKLPMADGRLKTGRAEQASRLSNPASRRNWDGAARSGLTRCKAALPCGRVSGATPETTGATPVPPAVFTTVNRKSKIVNGFTLVELLVVISIIAILAAFAFPVLSAVKRHQYISQTKGEMGQLEAAINSYHAAYGFYPPGNGTAGANGQVNQLYYELEGTTNIAGVFCVMNNTNDQLSAAQVQQPTAFGVAGFVNCSKFNAGEDSQPARNFIHELKPNQMGICSNNPPTFGFTILTGSVGGPDLAYKPLNASGLNPWRYVSPGVNNPGSYDLWIQLVIHGRTNLICNWSKQVQINNPLP